MFRKSGSKGLAARGGENVQGGGRGKTARSEGWRIVAFVVPFATVICFEAFADIRANMPSGLPVQVKPTFQEPYGPSFSFPQGGQSNLGGTGGTASGTGGVDAGGSALNTMLAQSWGSSAESAAAARGVNASALAATCVMESGCQNTAAGSGGTASGAFQMIDSTYQADIAGALALDPTIASSVTSGLDGKMDPTTEAYAAAYELRQDALLLQNNGVANPTVLDTRAVYQFGAWSGAKVAQADPSSNLSQLLNLSPAQLSANGITSSTTVGQWQQTVSSKLGSTANQVVLSSSS
jgi:hypothetical protein